jgi:hypothetical protein
MIELDLTQYAEKTGRAKLTKEKANNKRGPNAIIARDAWRHLPLFGKNVSKERDRLKINWKFPRETV